MRAKLLFSANKIKIFHLDQFYIVFTWSPLNRRILLIEIVVKKTETIDHLSFWKMAEKNTYTHRLFGISVRPSESSNKWRLHEKSVIWSSCTCYQSTCAWHGTGYTRHMSKMKLYEARACHNIHRKREREKKTHNDKLQGEKAKADDFRHIQAMAPNIGWCGVFIQMIFLSFTFQAGFPKKN